MGQDQKCQRDKKKKGFFARLIEKIDNNLEEKVKKSSGCCDPGEKSGGTCC